MKLAIGLVLAAALAIGFLLALRRTPKEIVLVDDGATLDYESLIQLDAEALAEQGIGDAYRELEHELRARGIEPAPIEEIADEGGASYTVRCRGAVYPIYRDANDEESWGLAAYAFFAIINEQLPKSGPRFYAINGGNDLGGLFLTEDEVRRARAALSRRSDWPYLPTKDAPLFGQPD